MITLTNNNLETNLMCIYIYLTDRIIVQELIPSNITNWGFEYSMAKESGRILPRMLNGLLPHSNANGHPAFSEQEMATLFLAPGHTPAPPPPPFDGKSNSKESKVKTKE